MKPTILFAILLPITTLVQKVFLIRPFVSYANTNIIGDVPHNYVAEQLCFNLFR